ncbi:hypothetical protein WI67_09465 [Burkholderia cepacia]|nr:hypothetical protein WI67_09465 [Burkholderia cepacia]
MTSRGSTRDTAACRAAAMPLPQHGTASGSRESIVTATRNAHAPPGRPAHRIRCARTGSGSGPRAPFSA